MAVTCVPETVAMAGLLEVNTHSPVEVDVGNEILNGASPKPMDIGAKVPTTGMIPFKLKLNCAVAGAQKMSEACVAVIIALPTPTGVTSFPETVAIFGFSDA